MTASRVLPFAAIVYLLTRPAAAEPSSTAWLEDVSLPSADTHETLVAFEHQLSDLKARGEGFDYLELALRSGVADGFAVAPRVQFSQRGEEPLRLDSVGFQWRWRWWDKAALPKFLTYGGYANDLDDGRDHLLGVGTASSYALGPLRLNADLRPTLNVGGDDGTAFELFYGVGMGYGWAWPAAARAGLEVFGILPLAGSRLFDPTFGEAAESHSLYYGPSVALATGPFWTSLSAVTGYGVTTAASQFMFRCVVGFQH